MAPINANPETIRENIVRAKQRRDAAQLELDEAIRELQWWRDGLAMFDPEGAATEQAEELADIEIRRLVPAGFTRSPTTRQLILFAIRAQPAGEWPIARIFDVAAMHRWIDADDQDLIGALARALPPITDYRLAGRLGMPVPQRPPLRPRSVGRRATSSDIRASRPGE
jgi:hypothetical protein